MSISEYAQIMKEAGISGGGHNGKTHGVAIGDNRIQIEHMLIVDISERWEKICKGAILALLELGHHVVHSLRIVAIAGSVGIVLWGCSRLITSIQKKSSLQCDGSSPQMR
jgi:hypothetical protein